MCCVCLLCPVQYIISAFYDLSCRVFTHVCAWCARDNANTQLLSLVCIDKRQMEISDEDMTTIVAFVLLLTSELLPFIDIRANGILHALLGACARVDVKQPDKLL